MFNFTNTLQKDHLTGYLFYFVLGGVFTMIKFKDFNTSEDLETFQKNNKIRLISAETIQKERWVREFYEPNVQYSSGFKTYNVVRLLYEV